MDKQIHQLEQARDRLTRLLDSYCRQVDEMCRENEAIEIRRMSSAYSQGDQGRQTDNCKLPPEAGEISDWQEAM